MSRRKCCCPTGCLISQDDFGRDDSTDIGSVLTEISGEWELIDQELVETGSVAGAIVVSTARNQYGSKRAVLTFWVTPTGSCPWQFRALVNADATAANYQWVDFAFSTASLTITTGGTSRTYDTNPGSDGRPSDWVWPTVVGNYIEITVCLTEGLLYGRLRVFTTPNVGGACGIPPFEDLVFAGCCWDNTAVIAGSGNGYAGIRWDAGDMTFDDWCYEAAYRDDPACPLCTCRCTPGHYPPWRIRVDFYTTADPTFCPCFNGGYGIFEYSCGGGAFNWVCVEGTVCTEDISYDGDDATIDCGYATQTDWFLRGLLSLTFLDLESVSIDCEAATFEIAWTLGWITVVPEICPDIEVPETILAVGTDAT